MKKIITSIKTLAVLGALSAAAFGGAIEGEEVKVMEAAERKEVRKVEVQEIKTEAVKDFKLIGDLGFKQTKHNDVKDLFKVDEVTVRGAKEIKEHGIFLMRGIFEKQKELFDSKDLGQIRVGLNAFYVTGCAYLARCEADYANEVKKRDLQIAALENELAGTLEQLKEEAVKKNVEMELDEGGE